MGRPAQKIAFMLSPSQSDVQHEQQHREAHTAQLLCGGGDACELDRCPPDRDSRRGELSSSGSDVGTAP
jgi:hypothetical protein